MDLSDSNSTVISGWREDLSVGIPEIDQEHRRFFAMVEDLDQALSRRDDKSEIRRLMNLIINDALLHFEHEEDIFSNSGYPDSAFHAGMHAQIANQLIKVKQQFDTTDFGVEWTGKGIEIREILMDHLLSADMKYRDFFRNRYALS